MVPLVICPENLKEPPSLAARVPLVLVILLKVKGVVAPLAVKVPVLVRAALMAP